MSTPHNPVTRVVVFGAAGRMGSRLCRLSADDPSLALVAAVTRDDSPAIGAPAAPGHAAPTISDFAHSTGVSADVVIDFSSPAATPHALALARAARAALLVGTTALPESILRSLRDAAADIGVLVAPNTSLGVAAVARAAALLARALGSAFDVSLVEAHHSRKKDAPSGTALRLAAVVRDAGGNLPDHRILAIRAGETIGEHTLRFDAPGETIELSHRALSRDLFALGAIRAAKWLHARGPGWWTMDDVLGFGPG